MPCPILHWRLKTPKINLFAFLGIAFSLLSVHGCSFVPKTQVEAQPEKTEQPIAVDVAVATLGLLTDAVEYTGTSKPNQEVTVRSRVEGQLISLPVKVGDRLSKGQLVVQLDDSLLATEVVEAQAELAALESEVASAKAQVSNASTQLERARAQLQQAKNDAVRLGKLAAQGAIATQEAESAQTLARVAQQAVYSAQEQVKSSQQEVAAALGRVAAQKAVVSQHKQRQSYTRISAPISGVVTAKDSEQGNLINPGDEILRLADLSLVKVEVPVSELDLGKIYIGQIVQVKLDALPQEDFRGNVSQIAPVADSNTRQIPITITIPNLERKISGGLLARVKFASETKSKIIVPETAIQELSESETILFVLSDLRKGSVSQVEKRLVVTGNRDHGKVEVISGLELGERFVTRAGKPLEDGANVRLSILSEP